MAKSTTYGSSTSVVSPSFAAAHHQGAQGRGRPNSPSEASGGGVSEHVLVTPEISSSPPSSSSSYNILGPGVGASLAAETSSPALSVRTAVVRAPSPPVEEAVFDEETGCLMHPIRKSDTLQGLAIRYGVKIEDIKKVNRLWNTTDIWMYKTLKIPTDLEQYRQAQSKMLREKHAALAGQFLNSATQLLSQMVLRTSDQRSVSEASEAQLSLELAMGYLERNRFHLASAVESWRAACYGQLFMYHDDAPGRTELSSLDITAIQQQQEDRADELFQL